MLVDIVRQGGGGFFFEPASRARDVLPQASSGTTTDLAAQAKYSEAQ